MSRGDFMNIGKRIKEERERLGLSVDDVADALGKNRSTVYRYESNEIEKLPTNILEPLAKVLKTTPAYLMGWENGEEEIYIANINKKLKDRRIELGLTMLQVAKKTGVSEATISRWESGDIANMRRDKIVSLANALQVSPSFIMGWEDDNTSDTQPRAAFEMEACGLYKVQTKKFRMLGNIACGEPIFADEEYETLVEASSDICADFCLRAHGDSMIGARINDGDIVFIRQQNMVENGEIAAVLIDDEATLKRVQYEKDANVLMLFAENPQYKTLIFTGEELDKIKILGKAVAFQSFVK